VDVVAVLADSADPKQYIKKMKARNKILKLKICPILGDKNFQVESSPPKKRNAKFGALSPQGGHKTEMYLV